MFGCSAAATLGESAREAASSAGLREHPSHQFKAANHNPLMRATQNLNSLDGLEILKKSCTAQIYRITLVQPYNEIGVLTRSEITLYGCDDGSSQFSGAESK